MGLKTASEVTRLGKKFAERRKAGQANNPKNQQSRLGGGVVRAADRKKMR